MPPLLSLKQASQICNVSVVRLKEMLQRAGIEPRKLSNVELRNYQWEGKDKRILHGVFIEAQALESVVFKREWAKYKSQHEANEIFGQTRLFFD